MTKQRLYWCFQGMAVAGAVVGLALIYGLAARSEDIREGMQSTRVSLSSVAQQDTTLVAKAGASTQPASDKAAPKKVEKVDADISIFLTGENNGSLKPCGCAAFQLGGLARFTAHLKLQNEARDNPKLLLSNGQLFEGPGRQNEWEATVIGQAMGKLDYSVVNLTEREMVYGGAYLTNMFKHIAGVDFVSANYQPAELEGFVRDHSILELDVDGSTKTVGLTGVVDPNLVTGMYGDLPFRSREEGIDAVLPTIEAADYTVLLHMGSYDDARMLAEQYPQFDLIVTGHDEDAPNDTPTMVGSTMIAKTGNKNKYMVAIDVKQPGVDGQQATYTSIPVDGNVGKDPTVAGWLTAHRERVAQSNLMEENARIKSPPIEGAAYVGTQTCQTCHPDEHSVWNLTQHAEAFETLEEINEHRNPECIVCHSVGYGYKTGHFNMDTTPHLVDVGCEVCHGPGSLHVANPEKKGWSMASVDRCIDCHYSDHDPNFHPDDWLKIQHGKPDINKMMIEKLTKAKAETKEESSSY